MKALLKLSVGLSEKSRAVEQDVLDLVDAPPLR
jgi:hypothetical protein